MKRNAGGRLLTLKQVEKLDGDWELIQVVCKEAKKAAKLVEKTPNKKRFQKSQIQKSLKLIDKHHKQVKSSFREKSSVLVRLSPSCSDYIQSTLESFDEKIKYMMYEVKEWPYLTLSMWHFQMTLEGFASDYRNFGREVKMFRDLVKNTTRLMT